MIVLHGGFEDWRLLLWAETRPDDGGKPVRRRRGGKNAVAPPLPWAAGKADLTAAMVQAGLHDPEAPKKPATEEVLAWLPTVEGKPLQPGMGDLSGVEPTLSPWSVIASPLTAWQAIELLCSCADRPLLAPGLLVGEDLRTFVAAMRLAGALVARQEYLPGIRRRGHEFQAAWYPVVTGTDTSRRDALARALPGVARALMRPTDDDPRPPEHPASVVLEEFVRWIVDGLVRGQTALATGRRRTSSAEDFDSLHDQWLSALSSPDGMMVGDERELSAFAAQVREWARPVMAQAVAPFRLCFRLEEPTGTEDEEPDPALRSPAAFVELPEGWRVSYLLQAADDPSLIVPTAEAWKARGKKAGLLKRQGFSAKEYLLRALGEASRLSSEVENSLRDATPDGYELDATGAHRFLTETAGALEQAGFGVMLPAWWTRTGTKLQVSAKAHARGPQMQGAAGLTLESMITVDWELALGDDSLTLEELQALAKLKSPLVRVRGQWVQVDAESIAAAAAFWAKKATTEVRAKDLLRMALGAAEEAGGLPVQTVSGEGWIGQLLQDLDRHETLQQLPSPEGFSGTLRPYQVRGFSWLSFLARWGLGACLADDMGLGKTIQTLAMVQRSWSSNGRRPTLLICPTSVVGNWRKEAARFTPELPVMVHHGGDRQKGEAFTEAAKEHAIVISSYALLYRDEEMLQSIPWAAVVLDEAQNIKNPQTRQARAARSLPADTRVALTGTPVENNVGDLWSIMEFLNPGLLGSQADFKRRYFVPIQAHRDTAAAEQLKRLTGPFILRRLKTDRSIITDLPEKLEMKVFCNLTREQATLYEAVVQETQKALEGSEGIERRGIVLATLSKLKQACNHPAQLLGDGSALPGRSGKLARLTEMVEELTAAGDRALVFSQYAEMGGMIQRHIQGQLGCEVLFLHGAVSQKQRDAMVERFQSEDGPAVFILSLKAGGSGLNLTAANHVFHFDRWWNPAVENQATDRAFRIGQTKNVQVHKFLCVGTLEERLDEMIEAKREVAEWVVGTGEGWVTELTNDELRELFTLRESAVGD